MRNAAAFAKRVRPVTGQPAECPAHHGRDHQRRTCV